MNDATAVRILHLSDLHFGSDERFADESKVQLADSLRSDRLAHLASILSRGFAKGQLDLVAVSGDITFRGHADGFQAFVEHVGGPVGRLFDDPAALCVVPGNHDVRWGLDGSDREYFDKKFHDYLALVDSLACTSSLVPQGGVPLAQDGALKFTAGLKGPLYLDDAKKLLVVCINSAMRCGELDQDLSALLSANLDEAIDLLNAAHAGNPNGGCAVTIEDALNRLSRVQKRVREATRDVPHVTAVQLDRLADELRQAKERLGAAWGDYVKVAILHHHLVPFALQQTEHKPFELTADAAEVMSLLADYGVQVVLTGHKHQPYCQKFEIDGADILILGGMTVGGAPVPGASPGIRLLEIAAVEGDTVVQVANIPCGRLGEVKRLLDTARSKAETYRLSRRPILRRFPHEIENAIATQLYAKHFCKSDVRFEIEISDSGRDDGLLCFVTRLSYCVTNLTAEERPWNGEYNYDIASGALLELQVDAKPVALSDPKLKRALGVHIERTVQPKQKRAFLFKVREYFPRVGTNFFTSYHPATKLEVELTNRAANLHIDYELLYHNEEWPVVTAGNVSRVAINDGLLPYQGVRIFWKPES